MVLNRYPNIDLKTDFSFVSREQTLVYLEQILERKKEHSNIPEYFNNSRPELVEII